MLNIGSCINLTIMFSNGYFLALFLQKNLYRMLQKVFCNNLKRSYTECSLMVIFRFYFQNRKLSLHMFFLCGILPALCSSTVYA